MSLKIFHGFFILISILFTAGFALYSFRAGADTMGEASTLWGVTSAVLCVALLIYGVLFIQKARKLP